ncbi:HAD family hydrolase [Streptomyces sp. Go-475]|uniref:HAD family hydrolase n=1 Tax=Streptomyces sp. Go-475 TaxID=2072505 RepID=UPI000DF06BBD|nr:HAD family hydrolase [Streptomyces sp. Go-475]AXE86878.1 Phosphoglycolate phosphatase [Streptomyces sp. Go-475]
MTSRGETASTEELRRLLAPARYILWDLDGPICRLFAGHPASEVARELVQLIRRQGLGGLLTEEEGFYLDPQAVLLEVDKRHPDSDLITRLEDWLTQHELLAVPTALPTPYADPLIRTWSGLGARFAITTNNSALAAASYIETRHLEGCFPCIYGRTRNLSQMKPHPHSLLQALDALGADPSQALMLGDAGTDYQAAQELGVPFLGYARDDQKLRHLTHVGVQASHVVRSLEEVLVAITCPL